MTEPTANQAATPAELIRAHYAMQRGMFVSELNASDALIAARSSFAPAPMWNHIALLGNGPEEMALLDEAAARLSSHDRRPTVYIVEDGQSDAVRQQLAERGYEPFDREAWMVFEGASARPRGSSDLRIVEARTESELADFVSVFYHAFRITEPGYALALQRGVSEEGKRARHFVGYSGAKPVTCGTLISQSGLVCIYNVGTLPEARGRGHGAHLITALNEAAKGAGLLFLQVEKDAPAEALYLKLGFKPLFHRRGYRLGGWRPASGRAPEVAAVPPLAGMLGAVARRAEGPAAWGRETLALPAETLVMASKAAAKAGLSVEAFPAAALAALLARYTGEESAAFEIESEEGGALFLNTAFSLEAPAAEFVRSIAAAMRKARAEGTVKGADECPEALLSFSQTRNAPLVPLVFHWPKTAGMGLEISYQQQLFEKDQVRRMGAHLARLLEGLATRAEARASTLDLLTSSERQQLLVDWNRHPGGLFDGPDLVKMFEGQVEQTPDAVAVILAEPGTMRRPEQVTYRQLNRRANQLAHALRKAGVRPETMVGICLERSIHMIVSLWAVWKAGGAAVPLDPAYPQERLRFMAEETKAPVVITQEKLAWLFEGSPGLNLIRLDAEAARLGQENEKNLGAPASAESAAYVIYTSGSTGKPKGVVIEHAAIAAHTRDAQKYYGLSAHDRVLQFSSFNFDAALEQITPTLTTGAALVLRDNEVWSLKQFAECLRELGLTVADIPTAYWAQLAREWSEKPREVPPNRLRLVIVGGEALPPQALSHWAQTPLASVRLINAYGPTETTITATAHEVAAETSGERAGKSIPIGRARGGREMYVLDRWQNPVPIDVPGELHIGGRMLARGYLHRPELTAQKFIANPFSDDPKARLYRTGDLVRCLADGSLEFLGRLDDQVKIRGFRIELGEIESALRKHPQIKEAIVLAREDKPGEKRLAAYCTAKDPAMSESELRRHLRASLPEYMVPPSIVVMERFPLMPSGKIDRRALPAPEAGTGGEKEQFKKPTTPLELQIKLVFERVLKRRPIGVDVSFFELGGDSLQALELLVEVEKATGRPVPLGALYQSATIEGLAQVVGRAADQEAFKCLAPLQAGGSQPPLYFVHTTPGDVLGYGSLIYYLGPDQPCHGFQSVGLGDPAKAHTDVCEMAEHYVQQLKQHQPKGPYYLAGWCYGGIVAVEMARLLRERGDKIALLALLETVAGRPAKWNPRYYLHRVRCVVGMSPGRWANYLKAKLRYRKQAEIANRMRFRQIEKRPDEDPVSAEQTERRLAHLERIYNTNLEALNHYRTRRYPGKVTLFNAMEQDTAIIPDPEYGWVGLAGEIEVNMVPGKHDTMLAEPNVSGLARKLAAAIERAQKQFENSGPK